MIAPRLCKICENLIEVNEDFLLVASGQSGCGRNAEMYLDRKKGLVHLLFSVRKTQWKLRFKQSKAEVVTVRVPEKPVLQEPEAASTIYEVPETPILQPVEDVPIPENEWFEYATDERRLFGRVISFLRPRDGSNQCYGFIRASDELDYLYFKADWPTDCYGRQTVTIGDDLEFSPALTAHGMRQATKIMSFSQAQIVHSHDFRDDAIVRDIRENGNGFGERLVGGETVFIQQSDVLTEGELKPGVYFRYKPCAPKDEGRLMWRAKEIEIYAPEKEETQDLEAVSTVGEKK